MAEKFKDSLKLGDRVKFLDTHNKALELTGTVERIHPGEDDCVDINVEVDGKVVEVEHVRTAHAADVTVLKAKKSRKREEKPAAE